MTVNSSQVLIGTPDQLTSGAVNFAPVGTTLPTDVSSSLTGFKSGGYVSEDGVTLTPTYSTADIKDWSKTVVRTILDEFTGEVSFAFIQTDFDSLTAVFGEEAVSKTGNMISVKMRAQLPPRQSFVFNIKDGDAKVRIILPNAQASLDGDITFNASDPISWPVKLSASADSNGDSIIVLTDDGASTSTKTSGKA